MEAEALINSCPNELKFRWNRDAVFSGLNDLIRIAYLVPTNRIPIISLRYLPFAEFEAEEHVSLQNLAQANIDDSFPPLVFIESHKYKLHKGLMQVIGAQLAGHRYIWCWVLEWVVEYK